MFSRCGRRTIRNCRRCICTLYGSHPSPLMEYLRLSWLERSRLPRTVTNSPCSVGSSYRLLTTRMPCSLSVRRVGDCRYGVSWVDNDLFEMYGSLFGNLLGSRRLEDGEL